MQEQNTFSRGGTEKRSSVSEVKKEGQEDLGATGCKLIRIATNRRGKTAKATSCKRMRIRFCYVSLKAEEK